VFFSNCSYSINGFFRMAELHSLLHSLEGKQVKTRTLHKPPLVSQGRQGSARCIAASLTCFLVQPKMSSKCRTPRP
jgi:hypothetical protein